MSAPAYDFYRDSGIDWLGKVPRHWDTVRLRRLVEIKKRIAGEEGPDVLSITQRGIKVRDTTSNDGQLASSYAHYQLVEPGDFAMNHMDLLTGWVDISPFHGVTSPDYRVFSARSGANVDPRYLLWVLQQGYIGRTFFALGQGSSHLGRWRLPADAFNEFEVALPPQGEQRAIAAFLDRETGKIDALVEAQARLIELLKEKRQAVISHAVTKGLDPAAPMKDSGVEWLGQVPAHWELKRLRFVSDISTGDGDTVDADDEAEFAFYVRSPIIQRIGRFTHDCEAVLTSGDGAGVGKIFHYVRGKFSAHQRVYIFNHFRGLNAKFFFHYLRENFFKVALEGGAKSTVDSLRRPLIANFWMTVPSAEEQEAIVSKVELLSERFDGLTREAEAAITLLQERRSALISAAVTGKIDVRGLALEQAEAA